MIRRKKKFTFDLSFPSMQPKVFQRLGETQATDIEVTVTSEGVPYNLTGVRFGFEMRDDEGKIVIDEDQTRFTLTDVTKGKFTYRVDDKVFGFDGNAYLCYFVLKISGVRITTERFVVTNDEDVQKNTSGLREHYVSVIDDLVKSNKEAMEEAKKIKDMIEANQVVKKTGDIMTGNLTFQGDSERSLPFRTLGTNQEYVKIFANPDKFRAGMYSTKNAKNVFEYDGSTDTFNVNTNTNLLKKTGDTMTGNLHIDQGTTSDRRVAWTKDGNLLWGITSSQTGLSLYNWKNSKRAFDYNGDTDTFNITSSNTNLLKKTGDTMQGHLVFNPNREIQFKKNDGTSIVGMALDVNNNWFVWNNPADKYAWKLDGKTGEFIVNADNLLKKDKDTAWTNIPLQPNVTNIDGRVTQAKRSGDTVSINITYRATALTGNFVMLLPQAFRPSRTIVKHVIDGEGRVSQLVIDPDGSIYCAVLNQDVRDLITYVI